MKVPPLALDSLVEPLLGPEGWMRLALLRLDEDPFAARLAPVERAALARAARAAGADMARRILRSGRASAEARLRDHGVVIHEDGGRAASGPFVLHALYTAPPPRVTLYQRPLAVLERLCVASDLSSRLGPINVREVVLAHELCHHVVYTGGAPAALRPRVEVLRFGPWRRRAVVRTAEEIAAAGFAAEWCGLTWPPELLDSLTLAAWRDPAPAMDPTLTRMDAHADRTNDPARAVRGFLAAG